MGGGRAPSGYAYVPTLVLSKDISANDNHREFLLKRSKQLKGINLSYLKALQQYFLFTSRHALSFQETNCLLLAAGISLRVALTYFMVINSLTITVNPLIKHWSNHYQESTSLVAYQLLQISLIATSTIDFHN